MKYYRAKEYDLALQLPDKIIAAGGNDAPKALLERTRDSLERQGKLDEAEKHCTRMQKQLPGGEQRRRADNPLYQYYLTSIGNRAAGEDEFGYLARKRATLARFRQNSPASPFSKAADEALTACVGETKQLEPER